MDNPEGHYNKVPMRCRDVMRYRYSVQLAGVLGEMVIIPWASLIYVFSTSAKIKH